MNELIKTKGINFGLYYGLFLISLLLYAYAIDINFFVSYWYAGLVFVSFFVNGFWVLGSLKKAQDGFMSFKEGFSVFFISNALALLISAVLTFLIFSVIDPELQNTVKELTILTTTEMMENFNLPMDQMDKAIEDIRNQDNFSLVAQIKGYFSTLAISSIMGLLFALILKKNKEEEY